MHLRELTADRSVSIAEAVRSVAKADEKPVGRFIEHQSMFECRQALIEPATATTLARRKARKGEGQGSETGHHQCGEQSRWSGNRLHRESPRNGFPDEGEAWIRQHGRAGVADQSYRLSIFELAEDPR